MPASAVASPARSVFAASAAICERNEPKSTGLSAEAVGDADRTGDRPRSALGLAAIGPDGTGDGVYHEPFRIMSMVMEIISRACLITCRLAS